MNKSEAIRQLNPSVVTIHDNTAYDSDGNEVSYDADAVQTLMDSKAYIDSRQAEYPSIGDQLDMLWHAIDAGTLDTTSDFYTTIAAVKNDNPKPE